MKTTHHPSEREPAFEGTRRTKAFGLELAISDHDLKAKIKAAFELAKGGGRELDLTFSAGDSGESAPRQPALVERSPPIVLGACDLESPSITWGTHSPADQEQDELCAGVTQAPR